MTVLKVSLLLYFSSTDTLTSKRQKPRPSHACFFPELKQQTGTFFPLHLPYFGWHHQF